MKDQSSGKGGRNQIVQGPLQALLSRAPLAIRKQISEYPFGEPVCRLLNVHLREKCFLNYLRSSFNTLETVYQGHCKLQLSLVPCHASSID